MSNKLLVLQDKVLESYYTAKNTTELTHLKINEGDFILNILTTIKN